MRVAGLLIIIAWLLPVDVLAQAPRPGWIGDSATGCKVWNPAPQSHEAMLWSGACESGIAQGNGVVQWYRDGKAAGRFEGTMRDGKPQGHGIEVGVAGNQYVGTFEDGEFSGQGVLTWTSGMRFEGTFRGGLPDGPGRLVERDGETTQGRWVKGCLDDANVRKAVIVSVSTCPWPS